MNPWEVDFRLDGIDDNVELYGGPGPTNSNVNVTPPPDAIQEFRLQNGDFNAEFGHSVAGIINAVVRSGTNRISGDVWEFVRNDAFDANDYFSNQAGLPKAEYRQNQFGGTVGGPVVIPKLYNGKNKTFFFFDYQGSRYVTPRPYTDNVPTVGVNYPFLYTNTFNSVNSFTPFLDPAGNVPTLETALTSFNSQSPLSVTPNGLNLQGRQYDFQTPLYRDVQRDFPGSIWTA